MQKTLFNTLRNLKYALRCLAKSSGVLGNANTFTASVGMSAQPQWQSSIGLCRHALRALHETGLEILAEKRSVIWI